MKHRERIKIRKKSIFRALFVPLFMIMIFQAVLFYLVAVYGGIEETTNQNAADILNERLINRKNEIETLLVKSWTNLAGCVREVDDLYAEYALEYGSRPLTESEDLQIRFLTEASDLLVTTLRSNGVNGVYLILNNEAEKKDFVQGQSEEKIGLCIRDLDTTSNYTGTEDLLLERAPSALINVLGCSLDSWWEARYTFFSEQEGAFYYYPLNAAWDNPGVLGENLAYFEGAHQISRSDHEVVSYSIPLLDKNGYPYAVLGIELTTKYLSSLLPSQELDSSNKSCYILALENVETGECTAILGSGATYNRCFGRDAIFSNDDVTGTGGFEVSGRDQTRLYGTSAAIHIYNNNNPFENMQLSLVAFVETEELFSYIRRIKQTLAMVSLLSLIIGLAAMLVVSRHFTGPITSLAKRVQTLPPKNGFHLGRIGIREIDQLVDSIEELNQNASRDIARTEFFSRMSHDMRTPMNAIISFSSPELLEHVNEEVKDEYLEKIHSSGEYLLGLINEVLDMTKIESNKIDIQCISMSTVHLWDTIIPMIDKLAQKKRIQFIRDISMEKTEILVDEQHLNQIVMNLLSNAVKFTQQGGIVQLRVDMRTDPEQKEMLNCMVMVVDSGVGMSEEFMQKLYRPFEQENEGREGTGLGLSIAKKLIEMMGGTIECSSKKEEGTTFTLHFMLQKSTAQSRAMQTAVKLSDSQTHDIRKLKGKRILICEDHPLNTQIIVRVLERIGVETVTAENGQIGADTFEASETGYFDAILMDIRMPVMDGFKATGRIRNMNRADSMTIPVIAMTANAFSEDVRASSEAGMNAHLSKPIEPQKVYETLAELIR